MVEGSLNKARWAARYPHYDYAPGVVCQRARSFVFEAYHVSRKQQVCHASREGVNEIETGRTRVDGLGPTAVRIEFDPSKHHIRVHRINASKQIWMGRIESHRNAHRQARDRPLFMLHHLRSQIDAIAAAEHEVMCRTEAISVLENGSPAGVDLARFDSASRAERARTRECWSWL